METGGHRWKVITLPSSLGKKHEPELERETGERRRGRDILVAVDHGPKSKHAFDWAVVHFCRMADTLHLVHVVSKPNFYLLCGFLQSSDSNDEILFNATQSLMEKLAIEAYDVAMVQTEARILEGDVGKAICNEAARIKPAAVIMGTRGRGIIKSVLQGSASEHVFHHCSCPVVIVPPKESGGQSVV
ncbi:universal stress protein PHOS32 isoform X1 [Cryptomeria japonica]|uniref:universal stress protein PHOS32 isoform X1 n=1 Tax=Cryptomeria japonica TaxID=3369 RepID=UPI0027DA21F4|nr:universal stress protein PHOS32 isoform X1 [Cryptomeria japonica]